MVVVDVGSLTVVGVLMMDDLEAAQWMANVGVSVFVLPLILLGPFGGKFVQRVGPYRAGGLGMILGGDGSDEVLGGYIFNHKAPNEIEFDKGFKYPV